MTARRLDVNLHGFDGRMFFCFLSLNRNKALLDLLLLFLPQAVFFVLLTCRHLKHFALVNRACKVGNCNRNPTFSMTFLCLAAGSVVLLANVGGIRGSRVTSFIVANIILSSECKTKLSWQAILTWEEEPRRYEMASAANIAGLKWLRDMRVRVAKAIIVSVAVRLSVWPNVKASSQSATLAASRLDVC